jgi:hypothetical protein
LIDIPCVDTPKRRSLAAKGGFEAMASELTAPLCEHWRVSLGMRKQQQGACQCGGDEAVGPQAETTRIPWFRMS